MSQDLFDRGSTLLTSRLRWDQKQRTFYAMRHDGLPRVNKPFATASDAHYPAIDMAIRRLKPFWVGQITSGDKLCVFTALNGQLEAMSDAAGDYYDFTLNQRTQYLRKLRVMIDYMLLTGRGIIKATIDPLDDYNIVIEAISPFFLLMPQEALGFEDADEFIHVRQFTVDSYKRLDSRWDTTDETVAKIRGMAPGQQDVVIQQRRLQEGITYSTNTDQVIVWEHWTKTRGGHTVHTYSPQSPDSPLRKPYGNPYKCAGKESIPFCGFQMEVTDEGWYAPRGLAELLAPIEQYLTKLWNEKADAMTFANRPLYTGDKEIVNSANYRWQPGEYIPGNVRGVQQGTPPFNFDQEIGFAQSIGEQQSQSPDFGITASGDNGDTGGKPRTATENQRIASLQSSGSNDNAMMFREDLTKLYRHIWGMICQFKERDFLYYAAGETGTLPPQALHDQYLIEPDGSPDGWNKMARFQKAMAAKQSFAGDPNVDQEILTKRALNAYDGRVAMKAFVPTNMKGASEYEDEAMEINSLLAPPPGRPSFPATVKPNEDHPSRIKAIIDWIHACGQMRTPVDPQARQRVQQHLAQHIQMLKQQNPAAAKQIEQMVSQMEQSPTPGQGNGQSMQPPQRNGSMPPQTPMQPPQ